MKNIIITNEDGDKKELTESNFATYDNYFSIVRHIEWDHNGQHYYCDNCYQVRLIPHRQKLAILYMEENPEFPFPANIVLYNADKSVHKIPHQPPFVNETVIKTRINPFKQREGFSYLEDLITIEDREYLVIGIKTYAYMGSRMGHCTMIEERALDIETGLFHPTWNKGPIYW